MKVSLFKSGSVAGGPNSPRPKPGESIRGKISGPIPIPDDEFPMRNPGTGIATTSPEEIERQWQPEQQPASTQREMPPSRNADSHADLSSSPPAPSALPRGSPQSQRRTNPSSTMRHSNLSEATEQSGGSKEKPQRKKSTLRGAFSKLFGRRKKNESTSTAGQRASTVQRPSQHQSDPSALAREVPKETDSKRSASLPITEYDRALRSHSVGPNDMVAIESVRNSMHADFSLAHRRRAATATSHLFRRKNGELGGLSPRPASSHNLQASRSDEDPNEIGRAITSDIIGHKRRSRSLSGLEDAGDGHHTTRRRSDEIRYWRESYDPTFMSPISSNPADIDQDDTGPVSMDLPRPAEEHEQVPKTPLQPFDFGDMSQTHLKEMAGMKITQAASLESRVGSLEERMRRLEQRLGHLYSAHLGHQTPHEQPTREPPPVPNHGPRTSSHYSASIHSRESQLSMVDAQAYSGTTQLSAPSGKNRPTSGATIKDLAGVPPMSQTANGPFTSEHYTTLLALLEMERGARLTLEAQVRRLTQRLEAMSSNAAPQVRPFVNLEPPPTARSFGNVSAFDHDDSEDEHRRNGVKNRGMALEDSGIATGSTTGGDDDDISETFATPREENPYGYEGIGDELTDDEEEKRRKAARTLSLSQLTLGKPHPKAVI